MMNSLVLTCFPLLYFYNLLYYTDVGSVLFVLASYSCSIRNHHLKSALVSFVRIGQAMSQFRRPISLHRRSARRTICESISKIPTFSKHKISRARVFLCLWKSILWRLFSFPFYVPDHRLIFSWVQYQFYFGKQTLYGSALPLEL